MTVSEIFEIANLSLHGPVQWMAAIRESSKGVYVVARADDPHVGCVSCPLPLRSSIPTGVRIDKAYEVERWLTEESIIYIGKSDQPLSRRVSQFYQHQCGNPSPHAGGQIVLLLSCKLWLYWSPSSHPEISERDMLSAFKNKVGRFPFANFDGKRRPRRVRGLA